MNNIKDNSAKHWRTEIPNSIIKGSRSDISIYAKWLYVYIKSVAGENGECWQSTKTMAEGAGMSAGKISDAKKELKKHNLIEIEYGDHKNGKSDTITIKDIWIDNYKEFQFRYDTPSSHEHPCSPHEHTPSRDEPKKESIKNNPKKNNSKPHIPDIEDVIAYFKDNDFPESLAHSFYDYYDASIEDMDGAKYWRDSRGNKVINWKQKAQAVWFKDENRQKQSHQYNIL